MAALRIRGFVRHDVGSLWLAASVLQQLFSLMEMKMKVSDDARAAFRCWDVRASSRCCSEGSAP